MKSKKFEDLRGTNTAIHCPTQADWDKVTEICGYEWLSAAWIKYKENSCIGLSGQWFGPTHLFIDEKHTIIPAADFIAANTEQTPDLTGTRPAIEWLQFLPEPYRGKALEAVKVAPFSPNKICKYNDCVFYSISWTETKNDSLWEGIHYHLHNPEKHPLPPLPSEGVEAEKVEAEKTETIKRPSKEEISEFVKNLLITVDEQRIKIESLEKQLSEKPDTAEPDILLTPAEPEVKLPVTIEERDAYCNTLVDGKRIFTHVKQEFAVLHKKTCNKTNAFLTLLKIAEAQNEIVPRGEWVYYAEYEIAKDKIKPRKRVMDTTAYGYGLITFHSEQGLKDCIEANRELWMDLLKSE